MQKECLYPISKVLKSKSKNTILIISVNSGGFGSRNGPGVINGPVGNTEFFLYNSSFSEAQPSKVNFFVHYFKIVETWLC